jgi:hypothetical protein
MPSFDEWYDDNLRALLKGNLRGGLMAAWEAAQQAERERIVKIIYEATNGHGNHDYLLEKVNDH